MSEIIPVLGIVGLFVVGALAVLHTLFRGSAEMLKHNLWSLLGAIGLTIWILYFISRSGK